MSRWLVLLLTVVCSFGADAPKAPDYTELVLQAREAGRKGLMGKALDALDAAEKLDTNRLESFYLRGEICSIMKKHPDAIMAFTRVLEIDPKASTAFNRRGLELFVTGQVEKALEDFDRYLELEPQNKPYHWQRGIALYLAGKHEAGRKQFEIHQTVNSQDVENSVFHFVCVAKAENFEKARALLIPIQSDSRVPMMEVFNLFAGKGTAEDVMNAVKRDNPSPAQLEGRTFFAHYYLGLYYEAKGETKTAFEHFKLAATDFGQDHYMGDVAKVHFQRRLK